MTSRLIITTVFLSIVMIVPIAFAASSPTNAGTGQTSPTNTGTPQQGHTGGPNTTLVNPLGTGGSSLENFLYSVLDFMVRIGTILIILSMVYVGFQYVWVARNNPSKISDVHQMLLWTIVGGLILLGAKALAMGIGATISALSGS